MTCSISGGTGDAPALKMIELSVCGSATKELIPMEVKDWTYEEMPEFTQDR